MRCPHRFYNKHILGRRSNAVNWRQMVQYAVSYVINDYYTLPAKSRSSLKVLESIQRRWTNKVDMFQSSCHFHVIRAVITDHLLQWLKSENDATPPLFLFENVSAWIEELQFELSMIFQVVEWSENSFVIKKFLVDDDSDVIMTFKHMATVVSHKAFLTMPDRIEIYTLISGQKYVFCPDSDDLSKSLDYLRLTKRLYQESNDYKKSSDTECGTCPFKVNCYSAADSQNRRIF